MPLKPAVEAARRREGLVLLSLAAISTILFATTSLDLTAARLFYRPGLEDPWPFAHRLPWSLLYGAAPWITAALVLTGLAALGVGALRRRDTLRRNGVFLLLTLVAGPGLVVNLLFKDHWGRPRPRDVVEFGGTSTYVAPLIPSRQGGASFPCGHCSAGFLLAAGWWVWERRQRSWAWASLAAGALAGTALGIGRMSAGGHFLSDVVWSALLALGIAHVLHVHVLRIPGADAEARPPGLRSPLQTLLAAAAALGGAGILLAIFGTPHGTSLAARVPLGAPPRPPWAFELTARRAGVDVVLIDEAQDIEIEGELHGFGLPTSVLSTKVDVENGAVPTVRYRILQTGWFTDLDGSVRIRIPVAALERVTVRVDRGDIRVTDGTGTPGGSRPALDLHTGYGRVLRPSPRPLRTSP